MAQPSSYNRAFNFSNYQSENPATPLPGAQVDLELSRIKAVIDQIRAVIASIQRDDLALANDTVGYDQLKSEISVGVNPPSTWLTLTNYVVRDAVFKDQKFYICETSHVSGTFSTDLAGGKWELIADFTAAQAAALVTYDNGESGLTATNMQDAMDELVASVNVTSVFSRSGAVVAAASDYDANQVDFDPTGLTHTDAADVQEALEDHDAAIAGRAASSHTHAQSDITDLESALSAKVPTSRTVATAGLASGGGDLSAGRTITVTEASEEEAQAGTASTVVMTPRRVRDQAATFGYGLVKAFAVVTVSGTTPTLAGGFNVASVSRVNAGTYRINFTTELASAVYALIGTGLDLANPTPRIIGATTKNVAYCIFEVVVATNGDAADVSFDVAVFGA